MPFLEIEGRKLYYVYEPAAFYASQAETIVLMHTNISDHSIYDDMAASLHGEYNLLRFDFQGLGRSEKGQDEMTTDMHVRDVGCLLHSLNIGPVHLIGMGFSGLVALEFNRQHPSLVKKMVLLSMICFPKDTLPAVNEHRRSILSDGKSVPPVDYILETATTLPAGAKGYEKLRKMTEKVDASVYAQIMYLSINSNPIPYLEETDVPCLILAGDQEVLFPQNVLAFHAAFLPNVRYTVIPNASSFLMLDQPEITAHIVREFLHAKSSVRQSDQVVGAIYEDVRKYTETMYQTVLKDKLNTLEIDLLSSFRVCVNGKQILKGWNQRYAKQILIYLLLHKSATREELCETLWPDVPLPAAKKNLRTYLSHVKRLLHRHARKDTILVADREHLSLHADISGDATALVRDVREAVKETDESRKISLVAAILQSLNGKGFRPVLYDDWFLTRHHKMEETLVECTVWLSETLLARGDSKAAIQHATDAIPIFPNNEPIYDVLLACCTKTRDHQQYAYWEKQKAKTWG